jgi:hypothetical protein
MRAEAIRQTIEVITDVRPDLVQCNWLPLGGQRFSSLGRTVPLTGSF